jgi:hypothetical protein
VATSAGNSRAYNRNSVAVGAGDTGTVGRGGGIVNTLTAEGLLESIRQVKAELERNAPVEPVVRIVESVYCLRQTDQPNKVHKVRRWMSDQYHYRIQKKWIKRWGYAKEPTAYKISGQQSYFNGPAESVVVMHPILAARLREQQRQEEWSKFTSLNGSTFRLGNWL